MTPFGRGDARAPHRRHRPLADINVTPLVDVMLVLLVVFMITAPMLAAGLKVDLPRAATAKPLPASPPVVVTIGRDGTLAVGSDAVDPAGLVAAVRKRTAGDLERPVRVRGDREAPYGEVVAAVDRLAAAGYGHIALVSRALAPAPAPVAGDARAAPSPLAPPAEARP